MITSKHLEDALVGNRVDLNNNVDQWLEKKVLPFYTYSGKCFEAPNGIRLDDLISVLKERDINAYTRSGGALKITTGGLNDL